MFEKFNQIAEQAATNASRRQFLGRLGRGALTVAAVVGGILALPAEAQAGRGGVGRCPPRCYRYRGICICPRGELRSESGR